MREGEGGRRGERAADEHADWLDRLYEGDVEEDEKSKRGTGRD